VSLGLTRDHHLMQRPIGVNPGDGLTGRDRYLFQCKLKACNADDAWAPYAAVKSP
jgi:hypothetical protein